MKVSGKTVYKHLDEIFHQSEKSELRSEDKWVIFSDLHMGDGGSTDDFNQNADLFATALEKHYLKNNYRLFLNGDVEELQRFKLSNIIEKWQNIYEIFNQFHLRTQLVKSIGNHDLELSLIKDYPYDFHLVDGYQLLWKDQPIFLFHGHQASKKYQKHNRLIGLTLKYFANPLGIKSYSVAHDSKKQYNIEKRVYHYSYYNNRVSIIGHTHRPLFESLHKVDRLKFKIEQMCRDYARGDHADASEIASSIKSHKKELKSYYKKNEDFNYQNYVYNSIFHIPCLFNSGTTIGKRGMTCLEIDNGQISLVHWFDESISKKYLKKTGYEPSKLGDTNYFRLVINQESLDYVFTRIKLLS